LPAPKESSRGPAALIQEAGLGFSNWTWFSPRKPDLRSLRAGVAHKKATTEVAAKFREETSKKAALGCQAHIALHNGVRKRAQPNLALRLLQWSVCGDCATFTVIYSRVTHPDRRKRRLDLEPVAGQKVKILLRDRRV
jgi:hypothetical protein